MTNLVLNTKNATAYNTAISVATDNSVIRMTSQEIADLVQSRHDDVKRSIERLVASGVIIQPPMADEQSLDTLGRSRTTKVYVFEGDQGERDTTIIVAQLSPLFLGQVVDQWRFLKQQVLEMNKPSYMIEDDEKRALRWIEERRETKVLEAKLNEATQVIEVMQPTVDAYELIAGKKGSMCFTNAYKYLSGIKLKEMKQWMYDKKWINKDRYSRDTIGYYQNMNGYLVEKVTTHQPQIRITYKGLAAMAKQMKIELNAEDFQ